MHKALKMLDIITLPEDMTTHWLTLALQQAGHLSKGQVASFEFNYFGTGKMGDNARLNLAYAGHANGAPETIIAKLPAQDETARTIAGFRGACSVPGRPIGRGCPGATLRHCLNREFQ